MGDDDGAASTRASLGWTARLLDARTRVAVLTVGAVALATAAVVIGLPSPAKLPTGLGRLVILPVLPEDSAELRAYRLNLTWLDQRGGQSRDGSSALVWDTYRDPEGEEARPAMLDPATMAGPALYVAVAQGEERTTAWLRTCSTETDLRTPQVSRTPQAPRRITEVAALPASQDNLLKLLDRVEYGDDRDYTYFRLDDRGTATGWWFTRCPAPAGTTTAGDSRELHTALPELTVVLPDLEELKVVQTGESPATLTPGGTPDPPTASERLTGIDVIATVDQLPLGWSNSQVRAGQGRASSREGSLLWEAVVEERPRDLDLTVVRTGPVIVDAVSATGSRAADRDLFWSGLLVGLACSCLLMLFETIPWRRTDRSHQQQSEAN